MKNCKKHIESCDCKITLPVECIRWYGEDTTFLPMKTNENLESILLKIEQHIQDSQQGTVNIENIGEGTGVYAGISFDNKHQFKSLNAGEGIEIYGTPETITIKTNLNLEHNFLEGLQGGEEGQYYHLNQIQYDALGTIPNLQQVLEAGSIANVSTNLEIQTPNINIGTTGSQLNLYEGGNLRLSEGATIQGGTNLPGAFSGFTMTNSNTAFRLGQDSINKHILLAVDNILSVVDENGFRLGFPDGSYTFPNSPGTNNQILQTDTGGILTWRDLPTTDLSNYYTKAEVDDKFTLAPKSFNSIDGNLEFPIFIFERGAWNENIREIGNLFIDDNGDYIWTYTGWQGTYANDNIAIGALKSTNNGRTWTDLGQLTPLGFEDPFLIKFNNQYLLYSEKKTGATHVGINLHSGSVLSSLADEGVVVGKGATGTWDGADRSSPTLFVENDIVHLLFEGRSATGAGNTGGAIGRATSNDGRVFSVASSPSVIGYIYTSITDSNTYKLNWSSHLVPDDIVKLDGIYYMTAHAYNGSTFATALLSSTDLINWQDNIGTWLNYSLRNEENGGNGVSLYVEQNKLTAIYPLLDADTRWKIYKGYFSVKIGNYARYSTQNSSATYKISPTQKSEYIDFNNASASAVTLSSDINSGKGLVKTIRNNKATPITITPESGVTIDGVATPLTIESNKIVELISNNVNSWITFSKKDIISSLDLKLNKPTTTGNPTTHPWVILEDGLGNPVRYAAGDLGKNLANSDLTQTAPRIFETLGQSLSFRTLPDMRSNTAFVNFLGQNATGQLARIGYQAFKAEAESWTSAQRLEYGQIMNDGTGSPGAMSVNLISPPIIQNTFDSNEYILLRGANLNLSSIVRKIEILNATTNAVVATIPDSQIQVYASGTELIFYYNFLDFPIGDYRLRITSGIRIYTTTLNLSVVAEVENIDTSNLNWDIIYDGAITPNPSDLAFGSNFQITTPIGIGSVPKISVKSDELFALGENFYLEMSIDIGSKGGGSVTDMNISKLGIGYSSSMNNLAFNTLVNYGYSWHFNTEIRNYNNNTVLAGSVTTPTNQTVIFIKTGNLFRTIVGNSNSSQTLSNNSGYSMFLNFVGRSTTQVIQGQIIKAFKFN